MTDEDQNLQPSLASRALMFVDRHAVALASLLGGLIVGGLLGWWVASYVQCSAGDSECQTNVDAVGAAGTWVGGLGTIGAVLFAVVAFRSEEAARREERRLAEVAEADRRREYEESAEERAALAADREQRALERAEAEARIQEEADSIRLTLAPAMRLATMIASVRVSVTNDNATAVAYKLRVRHPVLGNFIEVHSLTPSRREHFDVPIGEHPRRPTEVPFDWIPPGADFREWFQGEAERLSVEFLMHDRMWHKVGTAPAERID